MVKQSGRRIAGDGALFLDKTGRWVAMINLGYRDGKRFRKKFSAKTQAECNKKLKDFLRELDDGVITDKSKLSEWIEHWLTDICPQRTEEKTLYNYRRKMELHVIPVIGDIQLKLLSPDDIRTMEKLIRTEGAAHAAKAKVNEAIKEHGKDSPQAQAAQKKLDAAKGKGLSESTVRQVHVILSRCLKVAEREKKIKRNPVAMIDAPSTVVNPTAVLSVEDAKKVLAGAVDARDLARLTCALILGMRQGEVLALKWDDVDLVNGSLRVDEAMTQVPGKKAFLKAPKTKASYRFIPLPQPVAAVLQAYRDTVDDPAGPAYVFPGIKGASMEHTRDWKAWSAALERVGVAHIPLRGARGTASTLLEEMGVPERVIADILGHANVKVTMTHYLHSNEQQRGNALDGLARELAIAPIVKSE